ncbi:MAG: hypothetical protein H8D34_02975 [Chloroflexi bacterium]|nr:hypothetical protein [Chloroflexota bacterium]MBL7161759.1 hypothetical protein [Anaerolineales bacterium]
MNKSRTFLLGLVWVVLIAIILVAFVLFLRVAQEALRDPASEAEAPQAPAEPYTFLGEEPIQLAWFYRPPGNGNISSIAQNFDTFVLTKQDFAERDQLKELGVDAPIMQYLLFENIHDPGSCTKNPWRNQVAYNVGDFCTISEDHPDWFLLNVDGSRMFSKNSGDQDFVRMDPGNSGWRNFWLERAAEGQEDLGWEGVFMDNVEASFSKFERIGVYPAAYPTEADFLAEVEEALAYYYINYFQPKGRPLFANIISLRDPEVWFRYMQYLDGAMIEGWAVDWSDGYLSPEKWNEHMYIAEKTQALGKQVILVSQGDQNNVERQQFAFASYLLINHGLASFRYADASAYNEAWYYNNYYIDIGEPLGVRYQDGNEWRRDFSNGTVIVNPKKHTAEIITP